MDLQQAYRAADRIKRAGSWGDGSYEALAAALAGAGAATVPSSPGWGFGLFALAVVLYGLRRAFRDAAGPRG